MMINSKYAKTFYSDMLTRSKYNELAHLVNEGTLDETPMAYKNTQEIIEAVKYTVDIVSIIKPIYKFKAYEI